MRPSSGALGMPPSLRLAAVVALLARLPADAGAPEVERIPLAQAPGSAASVSARGIAPSETRSYAVEIALDRVAFLAVELWYTKPTNGTPSPDPILMVAPDAAPAVFYSTAGDGDGDGDVDGQLATNASYFDERGFLLTRARQSVSVPASELTAGRWFVTVTNVPVWSFGILDFHLELRITDAPPCQASCSGHGTCGATRECTANPANFAGRAADRGFGASPTPSCT